MVVFLWQATAKNCLLTSYFVVTKGPEMMDCQSKIQQIKSGSIMDYEIVSCKNTTPSGSVSLYSKLKANNVKVNICFQILSLHE